MSEDINKAIAEVLANSPDGLPFSSIVYNLSFSVSDINRAIKQMIADGIIFSPIFQITQYGRTKYGDPNPPETGA